MRSKNRRRTFFCMVMISTVLFFGCKVFASVNYDLRETFTYNHISGDTNASFLEPGLSLTQDLGIRANGVGEDGWRYRSNISFRHVIDFKSGKVGNINLKNYNLSLTKGVVQFQIGRVYTDFGQYTMTQNMTGAVLSNNDKNLSLAMGIVKPYVPKKNLMRIAMGVLKELELDNPLSNFPGSEKLTFNIGLAFVSDSKNAPESIKPEESIVISTEIRARLLPAMEAIISMAGSSYDDDTTDLLKSIIGSAVKAEMLYQLPGLRWQTGAERVAPTFQNLSSPLSSDRLELYTKARVSISETLRFDTSYRIFSDNLEKQKARTITNQLLNLTVNQTWLEYRNRELRYGLKGRFIRTDDNSINTKTLAFEMRYKGRYGDLDYALGASRGWVTNILNSATNRSQLSIELELKGNYYLNDISTKPFINLKVEQDMPKAGQPDRTYTINLGSNFIISYDDRINANVRYILADRSGTGNDFTRIISAIAYNKELPKLNSNIELAAEVVNSIYPDASKNFQEVTTTVAYRVKF